METKDNSKEKHTQRRKMASSTLAIFLLVLLYSGLAAYSGKLFPIRLVSGTSMEPTLVAGDLIVIKDIPYSQIKEGDIIAYKTPDSAKAGNTPGSILHRVIGQKMKNGVRVLTTKGDNSDIDPWDVTSSDIRGELIFRIPSVGKPIGFLTSGRGIIFISIASVLTLIFVPVMYMFYTTVVNKPDDATVSASTQDARMAEEGVALKVEADLNPIIEKLTTLATEQAQLTSEQIQFRESISQLSNSIAYYATHLESHTAVVQDLGSVTNMLREMVEYQTNILRDAIANESQTVSLDKRSQSFSPRLKDPNDKRADEEAAKEAKKESVTRPNFSGFKDFDDKRADEEAEKESATRSNFSGFKDFDDKRADEEAAKEAEKESATRPNFSGLKDFDDKRADEEATKEAEKKPQKGIFLAASASWGDIPESPDHPDDPPTKTDGKSA